MTVVEFTFPQNGDSDFAENFATWLGRGNISNYVEEGMSFTPDYGVPDVDISQGKAYITTDQKTISGNGETRLTLDYVITTPADTLPLTDSTVNYIFLEPNVGTNDSPEFNAYQNEGNAGADELKIGEIDTTNDTSEELNRDPDADFENATIRESLGIPVFSEFSEATQASASIAFMDGNGSPDKGVYIYDGSQFISIGYREINQLEDVTGVESLQSDTLANRPAAGTQGRLFIDETNNRIQIDTGSTWVDIGTNSSNIDANELGFDPATQAELDAHTGTSDAHHTRPTAGNGLKDQSNTFNIEPTDFVGQFLSDNADNIDVQIGFGLEDDGSGQIQFDEDSQYTLTSQLIVNATLTAGGNIDLQNNNLIEPNQIQTSGSGSDVITFRDTFNSNSILTINEGGEVEINNGDLTDGTNVIFDQSATHVPLSILEQDSITVTAGNALSGGGVVQLGGSTTIDVATIQNTDLANSSVTVTAGDGLKNGGSVALGASTTLDVEPADFAGTFLSDDGSDNLTVDIGTGLENDGVGNIRVDEDFDYTFTSAIDFSAGLDTQGDVTDGAQVIWDASLQEIPDSAMGSIDNATLANSSVTVTAGNGLKNGGSVSLGSSTTIDVEPADFAGEHLVDDGSDNLALDISDDARVDFGTGDDMSIRYDTGNDSMRIADETGVADRFELDRTTGNLNIGGEITENASL